MPVKSLGLSGHRLTYQKKKACKVLIKLCYNISRDLKTIVSFENILKQALTQLSALSVNNLDLK